MSDREKYSEYSKPIVIKETLYRFSDLDYADRPTDLNTMAKALETIKDNLKKFKKEGKTYTKVRFALEEQYQDGYTRDDPILVIVGERLETPKETDKRIESNYFYRVTNITGALADIDYWLSKEGQEELKKIRLGKHNPMRNFSPKFLEFLEKIGEIKDGLGKGNK